MRERPQHANLIGRACATARQNQRGIRFGACGRVHDRLEDPSLTTPFLFNDALSI